MNKVCTKCKINKPLNDYYNDNKAKDGKFSKCKICTNAIHKKYNESDRGKITRAKYNKSDKGRLTKARYDKSDKGRLRNAKGVAKYQKSNKGKLTRVKYYKSDKGKLLMAKSNHNSRNWKSKTINNLTTNEKNIILFLQNYRCIGDCGRYFDKMEPTIDHIVPLSKSGDLIKENVQYLCKSCNSTKGIQEIDYRSTTHKQFIITIK